MPLGIKDPRTLMGRRGCLTNLDGSLSANFCTADDSAGRT